MDGLPDHGDHPCRGTDDRPRQKQPGRRPEPAVQPPAAEDPHQKRRDQLHPDPDESER
jgi:hypothetical protein